MTEALTATLTTTQGTVTVRLFPDHAPKTVRNFVELAEGGKEWTNPVTRAKSKDKLYDGTVFGAWSGNSRTVTAPCVVVSVAVSASVICVTPVFVVRPG